MTTIQIILLIIGLVVLIPVVKFLYKIYRLFKGIPSGPQYHKKRAPIEFYSIDQGNQDKVIYAPTYRKQLFDELDNKFSWDKFEIYDNRFWEYMYEFFDTLPELAGKIDPDKEFFDNLSRPQKIFYTFLTFNGDTDNGGVRQFFFNRPEFIFAVLEVFDELKLDRLKKDYEKCLDEFMNSSDSYNKRTLLFDAKNQTWIKRWHEFCTGKLKLSSPDRIENYYYKDSFKKELFITFVKYIDNHIDKFTKK